MDIIKLFLFRLIKFTDIGLLGIYYLFGAIIMVSLLNVMFKKMYKSDIKKTKSSVLIFQISIQAAVIMISSNILRRTVRSIPYPFEGALGYQHMLTKETNGGIIIAFAMMTAFSDFKDRVFELVTRLTDDILVIFK